jgi:hypothetical protein
VRAEGSLKEDTVEPDNDPPARPAVPPDTAPATGTTDVRKTELAPGEEPVTTGTLFLTMIVLMIIGAVWVIMYARLIDR